MIGTNTTSRLRRNMTMNKDGSSSTRDMAHIIDMAQGRAEVIMAGICSDKSKNHQLDIQECEDDFHALKGMFDRMRADRDLWKEVAENLAAELGKKEYADAEYEICKQVAQGVAW